MFGICKWFYQTIKTITPDIVPMVIIHQVIHQVYHSNTKVTNQILTRIYTILTLHVYFYVILTYKNTSKGV